MPAVVMVPLQVANELALSVMPVQPERGFAPSLKSIVPVGKPLPGDTAMTVAVRVTVSPTFGVAGLWVIVTAVAAAPTVRLTPLDALPK